MLLSGSRMGIQPEAMSIDDKEIHKLATRVLPRQAQHDLTLPHPFYNRNAGSWSSWPQRRGDGLVSKVQGSSSGAAISPLITRLQIAIGNNRAKRRNSSQHRPDKVNSHSASVNMGKTARMHLRHMDDVSRRELFSQDSPPPFLQSIDGVIAFAGTGQSNASSSNESARNRRLKAGLHERWDCTFAICPAYDYYTLHPSFQHLHPLDCLYSFQGKGSYNRSSLPSKPKSRIDWLLLRGHGFHPDCRRGR